MTKIAYEPHPVSPERKAELVAAGFKIMDIAFKPADAPSAPVVKAVEIEIEAAPEVEAAPAPKATFKGRTSKGK
jgi:hypothetical protein